MHLNSYHQLSKNIIILVKVVASVVHTVAQNLGITVPADAKPSPLQTEEEVNWSMEVICHGLCLPLEDHMIIRFLLSVSSILEKILDSLNLHLSHELTLTRKPRDCVNIYCEWLSALLPNPKVCVPKPVLEDPNHYARKIITHFNHLFVPRKGEGEFSSFIFKFKQKTIFHRNQKHWRKC